VIRVKVRSGVKLMAHRHPEDELLPICVEGEVFSVKFHSSVSVRH
jgi:hypothetical protein